MQQTWGAGAPKRRNYHQKPPYGPKDKDTIMKKSGVIYTYKCNKMECDEEYIGQSARNFAEG